jgi:hypothetical protein
LQEFGVNVNLGFDSNDLRLFDIYAAKVYVVCCLKLVYGTNWRATLRSIKLLSEDCHW